MKRRNEGITAANHSTYQSNVHRSTFDTHPTHHGTSYSFQNILDDFLRKIRLPDMSMYSGYRASPHLSASSHVGPRSSMSTDFSETSSFISSAASNLSSVIGEFSVLCLHDYEPTDPDQLRFRKGDILAILKTEDTGWWAAALGSTIGWVPRGYVEPISEDVAEALKSVRHDLRDPSDAWDTASNYYQGSYRSSFGYGSETSSILSDPDAWDQRRVRGQY